MNRRFLLALMACAVVFTGMLALTLARGGRGTSHGRRSDGEREPQPVPRPARAPKPGRAGPDGRRAQRTWLVSGRVEDPRGRPIAGAYVREHETSVLTDAGGLYRIVLDRPLASFDVYAYGYRPMLGTISGRPLADRIFVCEGNGPWTKDFTLEPSASLAGRLFDPDRRPVAGARIYVLSPDHALLEETHVGNLVRSDADGYFRFPGLPEGTYDMGVRADGMLPALVRDVVIPQVGLVERVVSLLRGRSMVVRVRNGTEQTSVFAGDTRLRQRLAPPGGVGVLANALVGREYVDVPLVSVTLREKGRYTVTGLPPGSVDVWALDPGRITELGLGKLLDTTDSMVELTLVTATEIEIRVVDENTREPLDPTVSRTTDGGGQSLPVQFVGGAATVPADRRRHTLHFRLQGYEEAVLELPPRPDRWPEAFEVTMRPIASAATGGFTLVFEQPLGQRVALVGRDAAGRRVWTKHLNQFSPKERWLVAQLPFGEYSVSVLATGMIPVLLPRVVIAKGLNEHHRVHLSAGGGIEMKITDPDGKLLDKVGIILRDASGQQIDVHVMTSVSGRRAFVSINSLPLAATVRADSGLAPGAYSLTAFRAGREPTTEEFVVRGTEVAKVAIVLQSR